MGFPHPIFAASRAYLEQAYTSYTKGLLSPQDSYLLMLAIFQSSGKVTWKHSATCNPSDPITIKLVETNLSKLLTVIEKSECIVHPRFKQPKIVIREDSADLAQLPIYISLWEQNIEDFFTAKLSWEEMAKITEVERRLEKLILSGESPNKYVGVIADWACKVGDFPPELAASYKEVICSCFNLDKIFKLPITLIKEVLNHCEANIEVGTLHFHTLHSTLKEGIARHSGYLGTGGYVERDYVLLPSLDDTGLEEDNAKLDVEKNNLAIVIRSAPTKPPTAAEYPKPLDLLRAKLAWRTSRINEANLDKE